MEDRPVLRLERSPTERRFDAIAIAGLLVLVGITLATLLFVDGPVPTHFDAAGQPDAFGSKGVLLLLLVPAVSGAGLFVGLRAAPHTFNYPVRVTPENAPRLYRLGRELLAVTGAACAWILALLAASIGGVGAGIVPAPGPLLLVLVIALALAPVAVYAARMTRAA